ncbi:SEC-C metal-binding domain-containing protein [Neobacillus sp. 19]|uniref:SEC-C metal-binding domain-containing protein n=1 Tax=Neobacillus sp. 19 TaxID=3394458 RepID=UPI003BF6EB5B
MENINRNDSCPCGSGKKYKKCCGASEAVSITQIIENEIDELQKQLLHFAYYHYGHEIHEDFEILQTMIDIENEQELEFYELIHSIWFSLFEGLDDGKTIIQKFIAVEAAKIKRPKLRQILQTWAYAKTIAGRVLEVENNKLTVEDGFTLEPLEAVITNMPITIEKGSFFIGILLPYEQSHVFFPSPFVLPGLKPEHGFSYIEDSSLDADYDSPQEFLTDFFMEVLSELPMIGGLLEINDLAWPAPIYKEVADLFKEKMELLFPPPVVDAVVILWLDFSHKRPKRIKNPNLYVAALHYLMSTLAPMEAAVTQKELAKQYGVSASSISSIVSELESELEEEISDLIGLLNGIEQISDQLHAEKAPVIPFPDNRGSLIEEKHEGTGPIVQTMASMDQTPKKKVRKISRRDEERARNLIYDAFQSEGKQRYKFAEEALKLNPNCVDAYVILAEKTNSLEDAILLYEKGIQAGKRELGKDFFQENTGSFWGLIETRPFMRAKIHYAEALSLLGKIMEAARQYEELLELNPMDNQGVRYSLFVAYVDLEEYKKAGQLLQQYEEASAQHVYNKLLLELSENGFSKEAQMLLKAAKTVNKHVIAYLTGKKRLPAYPPDFYHYGDENEAIVYADMHLHLWRKINGLQEWLKGK